MASLRHITAWLAPHAARWRLSPGAEPRSASQGAVGQFARGSLALPKVVEHLDGMGRAGPRKREAVEALYGAFRTFVESPEYDPLRFEQLTRGEALQLVLHRRSLGELAQAIARKLSGPATSFPMSHFLESEEGAEMTFETLPSEWDRWDVEQRLAHLDQSFRESASSWFGENLREPRSQLIEEWLARKA